MEKKKIEHLLAYNVEEVIVKEHLERDLTRGEPLRVKLGMDPSAPDLHLGHTVVLRKLRDFQDLGHTVVFIIGDYTGRIGDPTGKSKTRPQLDAATVEKNAKTYFDQVDKILNIKQCEIHFNSEWFKKMPFEEVIKLTANFTTARVIERDDFQKRLKSGEELGIHELLYPIMQAYDSIAVRAAVEIGGTDQKFNMLAGRDLQRKMGMPEQDVITCPLLVGLDGVQKMSKSLGNYVGITEAPAQMYGKLMTIPDSLISSYFKLLTELTVPEKEIKTNPRDSKARLARTIVEMYHGASAAKQAEEEFVRTFQKHETPERVMSYELRVMSIGIVDLLVKTKLSESKSEARRVVEQGGVQIDGKVIKDPLTTITLTKKGVLIQKGKRHFVRVMYGA
ncbi:tyrosine--tRNA ligase [Candidatus Uhrbacteria bacterium RIFCSPLOWO2_01_FULL_47_24]|uniref:Tyrosine--tRNA ligase n=1 Tax=Candidatus Uhrbacteria bacterium RIFCSPLOWO2_01_FULL_47_24 TaxID=1802401 RepID=A0A1F7US05_9BACT|nr:MAG: tyrosine--tRNA ligase [Candidatus Uhrbacteria bacterium RIFCSPHIGHO2_01_FULL_47_11]OGL67770.1 MAG: tyrosine--tRNA ligase [Candidatus Uhrbacteria bacterium RIFCSPHIGHO2_02_FULL_46_47]OGL76673.1 MAG: tyrosine--tRNA ligase [Candidatus Uhrbacteria bacterium RIFCSPHIGHO2_12_FULL_47_11]OGL81029.1 MAG: tyrosine--tRNA ligase [Candidatus Uhrbacteria bacterium RIFCSPLOWO2_01_FULL_47_24]OGL84379.1 MAG: tyrosine--tRNA ligase [Candidatus Uhrbacteria bacterium RIFCSPLOWO2_02_FULL_46_25]OGL92023.1 MA